MSLDEQLCQCEVSKFLRNEIASLKHCYALLEEDRERIHTELMTQRGDRVLWETNYTALRERSEKLVAALEATGCLWSCNRYLEYGGKVEKRPCFKCVALAEYRGD